MWKLFCDRCGKNITSEHRNDLTYHYIEKRYANHALCFGDFEICDECNEQLREWFYALRRSDNE